MRIIKLKQKTAEDEPTYNPVYLVTFDKNTNMGLVKKVKIIQCIKIRWEKFKKPRKLTQCHNCQQFGHGSNNCNKAPRCVTCDKNHPTTHCDKPTDQKSFCVNCKGEHRASSSQCPEYIKKIGYLDNKKHTFRNTQQLRKKTNPGQLNQKDFPIPKWSNIKHQDQEHPLSKCIFIF